MRANAYYILGSVVVTVAYMLVLLAIGLALYDMVAHFTGWARLTWPPWLIYAVIAGCSIALGAFLGLIGLGAVEEKAGEFGVDVYLTVVSLFIIIPALLLAACILGVRQLWLWYAT